MADWSGLTIPLLEKIAGKLKRSDIDLLFFSGVCRSWRSAATLWKSWYTPLLILLPRSPKENNEIHYLYSPTNNMTFQVTLPKLVGKKHCLSSKGWLMTIASDDLSASLLHPLLNTEIKLPNMKTFRIHKFVLSSCPLLTQNYLLMIIYGREYRVAYWRPSQKEWSSIKFQKNIHDIAYNEKREKFYAIETSGNIIVFDANANGLIVVDRRILSRLPSGCLRKYKFPEEFFLVDSSFGLLVIVRGRLPDHRYFGFQVFEIDLTCGHWKEIENMGNNTLFLSRNGSFCIEAKNCEPNSIHFMNGLYETYWKYQDGCWGEGGMVVCNFGPAYYVGFLKHPWNQFLWIEPCFH